LAAFLLSLSGPISARTPALPISPIFIPIQIMIDGLLCRCREMKPVVVSLFNKQERDRFYCQVLSDYSTLCSICGRTLPSCKAVFGHMMRGHPKQRVFSTDLRRRKKKVSSRIYSRILIEYLNS